MGRQRRLWVSAQRRQESAENTGPVTVLPSVRSSRRWRSPSTQSTSAASAARTPSRGRLLVSGSASHARRWLLVELTLSTHQLSLLPALPFAVFVTWSRHKQST